MIDVEALVSLGENARVWARAYVRVVEALQQEGVPTAVARQEARWAAGLAAFGTVEDVGVCPRCGGEQVEDVTGAGDPMLVFVCTTCGHDWEVPRDLEDGP